MEFLNRMNEIMNYIENNLSSDISYEKIAKISCCSLHQFGRIFSYVTGVPLSEYIRRRRLTLAALDLQSSEEKIIDIALKYNYDSPNSFRRAFLEMHGVTPSEARSKGVVLKSYPMLAFHISIRGDDGMDYRIIEMGELNLVGISRLLTPDNGGAIWDEFLDQKMERHGKTPNEIIRDDLRLYRPPIWQMGLCLTKEDGSSTLFVGAESDGRIIDIEGLDTLCVPARTWAVFKTKPGGHVDELGKLYLRVQTEWLPASGYVHDKSMSAEVYPMNMMWNDPRYEPEVWIPIIKKM